MSNLDGLKHMGDERKRAADRLDKKASTDRNTEECYRKLPKSDISNAVKGLYHKL